MSPVPMKFLIPGPRESLSFVLGPAVSRFRSSFPFPRVLPGKIFPVRPLVETFNPHFLTLFWRSRWHFLEDRSDYAKRFRRLGGFVMPSTTLGWTALVSYTRSCFRSSRLSYGGSRVVLGWFSGGSRVVLGWFSGGTFELVIVALSCYQIIVEIKLSFCCLWSYV